MKNLKWRAVLVAGVVLAGIVYLIPSMSSQLPPWWAKVLPKERIHLGLDLQGGMHLILEVEAEKAVQNQAERMVEDIKDSLRQQRIPFTRIERAGKWDIQVQLASADAQGDLNKLMEKDYPTLKATGVETLSEGAVTTFTFTEPQVKHLLKMATDQALETIRNRVDQFGVTEPDIRPQGEDRILIQLPGVQDPQRAVALIGKTALLEFKLVSEEASTQQLKDGKLPAGVKMYPLRHTDATTGQTTERQIVLRDRTLMTGESITNAEVRIDTQYNKPYVSLEFDSQGARQFERISGENVKRQLAIVLDGTVYSAPVIQEKISGGKASITGTFTMEEARDLAIVLRAGALPAPVKILEQRTVGASLGSDSIRQGLLASLLGGIVTIVFMLVYYKVSGFIADFALLLNIPLILACLAAFEATLTLPGIAGIILSVGMAVDANVLIFERIREELRLGKTPRAAVETGFDRATLTILDSNITTLIAAVVLFQFGTGPVRGFAVTLTIGIFASMFTAIIATRVIFDYLLNYGRVKTLSI
ncbi:MAG: protein translocase subunit SecD [Syntrophobacteraceae bacterium]|nr:protein translocase subunit SecD [Syntrophobacteraceae bacterium]